MRRICYAYLMLIFTILLVGCQDDDAKIEEIKSPTNLQVTTEIQGADGGNPNGDGSGIVTFTVTADDAITYRLVYQGESVTEPSGIFEYRFSGSGIGVFSHTVSIVAVGEGGVSVSKTVQLDVLSSYQPPQALVDKLTSSTWQIKATSSKHFGLGPIGRTIFGEFFSASQNQMADTGMYDDRYIFNADGTFVHITNSLNDFPDTDPTGTIFGRVNLVDELGSSESGTLRDTDVIDYPLNDYTGTWSIGPATAEGSESLILSSKAFIGYYIGGTHTYEIFQYENQLNNDLVLRSTDGNNEFDWWFTITKDLSNEVTPPFDNLVWSDEFNTATLDTSKWVYDNGDGCPNLCGWGNNEEQYYREENTSISDGKLIITTKSEAFGGKSYTSSKLISSQKFSTRYGKFEASIKLPSAGGIWPAFWMLPENGNWPVTGEIDIMEARHSNPEIIGGTVHYSLNDAATFNGKEYDAGEDLSSDFHTYAVEWEEDEIRWYFDGQLYHTVTPDTTVNPWPFMQGQFYLILNVAVGGVNTPYTGNIAPTPGDYPTQMEVDYVRVYQ